MTASRPTAGLAPQLVAFRREWLRPEIVAGLSAAAIVIPKAMAYAAIAGLPVQVGLYTAMTAMLVYPLLGTSRPLSVSVTSAVAILTGTQVAAVVAATPGASPTSVAATLTLMVGGVLIVARILRLGFLANFISLPVLVGFETGVGVVIIAGQLHYLLGVDFASGGPLATFAELPARLPRAHLPTLVVSGVCLLLLWGLERWAPRVPPYLTVVALSIAVAMIVGLEGLGVHSIGKLPSGLPVVALPDLALVPVLWPAALGIGLMAFTDTITAGRAFLRKGEPAPVPDRELLAVGAANVAAAIVGGMPAAGGASQTAVADAAGARSQVSQWIAAGVVVATLLLLAPVVGRMPMPALAAVVVVASAPMLKVGELREIARVRPDEFSWAVVTALGVLWIGTLEGILIAVVFSILMLFYQANHPPVYAVEYDDASETFLRLEDPPGPGALPGLLILRTEGRLTFANVDRTQDLMRALVEKEGPSVLVLECSAIPDIEYTALARLTDAEAELASRGVELWLAAVNPDLSARIRRAPLGEVLGEDRMLAGLHRVLARWEARRA